jgi:putative Mn2+ efflux pump MntP
MSLQSVINVVVSWVPFFLLIGFWVWFMKRGLPQAQRQHILKSQEHMIRMEEFSSRIATALERIACKTP